VAIQQGVVLFPSADQIWSLYFALDRRNSSKLQQRNDEVASGNVESGNVESDQNTEERNEIMAQTVYVSPDGSVDCTSNYTNKSIDGTMETEDSESESESEEEKTISNRSSMLLEQFFSGSSEHVQTNTSSPNNASPNNSSKTSGFWRFFGF
jgi:hypothetical protein